MHDADKQQSINSVMVFCEAGCRQRVPFGQRSAHVSSECATAVLKCPFKGCVFTGKRVDIDTHTYTCPYGNQYSVEAVLQSLQESKETMQLVERNLLKQKTSKKVPPPQVDGTQVHYVTPMDTIAGIAIRYDVPIAELRRFNKLANDNIHVRNYLMIPRPPTKKSSSEDDVVASSPPSAPTDAAVGSSADTEPEAIQPDEKVLIALRKRQVVFGMMCMTKASESDALAYLYLAEYDLPLAISRFNDDAKWNDESSRLRKPRSLSEFIQQRSTETQRPPCNGPNCNQLLTPDRKHCSNCGKIFCHECITKREECSRLVPKSLLGVTKAGIADTVVVCNQCYNALVMPGVGSASAARK